MSDDYYRHQTLGGVVATELLLARTDEVVCVVRHVVATDFDFSFSLQLRARHPSPAIAEAARCLMPRLRLQEESDLAFPDSLTPVRFAVELDDGESFEPSQGEHPAPGLGLDVAVSSAARWEFGYRVPKLPTVGYVSFVFDWPSMQIENARVRLLASTFVQAAENAIRLWDS